MSIRIEVLPFIGVAIVVFGLATALALFLKKRKTATGLVVLGLVWIGYLLYFFRDPVRTPPQDPAFVLAGADGTVVAVTNVSANTYLKCDAVRVSIFLRLTDVHVNRAPLAGEIDFLGRFPGSRYFTFQEASSWHNTHNAILIDGDATRCLVKQIAGPVTREVVYWLEEGQSVSAGDKIGMMKFGSRLDTYLPAEDVEVRVAEGQRVRAGETVLAVVKEESIH